MTSYDAASVVCSAPAFGNQITTQPVSASGAALNIKCAFAASSSSSPGAAAVAAMTQSTAYIGDGVSAVRFTPPAHTSAYTITVRVLVDDVEVPGSYNVLVGRGRLTPDSPRVDRAWCQRLKPKCDEPISNFAFISNLRRYILVSAQEAANPGKTVILDAYLKPVVASGLVSVGRCRLTR